MHHNSSADGKIGYNYAENFVKIYIIKKGNVYILIQLSLTFVYMGAIDNKLW